MPLVALNPLFWTAHEHLGHTTAQPFEPEPFTLHPTPRLQHSDPNLSNQKPLGPSPLKDCGLGETFQAVGL